MATDLDDLLESIDPRGVEEEIASHADDALNSFSLSDASIEDWDEFQECLAEFHCHLESEILRGSGARGADLEFDWGRGVHLLHRAYGRSGEKAAFEMARTGAEGGLRAVLRVIARGLAEQVTDNVISARISQWWSDHSPDEVLEAAEEYLEKHGHLLPSELTEGSAARIRANFLQVLKEHPRLIARLRRVGR